ncbi:MAG: nicotinate (nicotinamide) nucleotide adenylyltransferase [Flavobacteriales bacterium]|nr:nicotinate (nicotinamide) nucleotide adenylyltransferase [Flavobacteriales bacterium]MBP6697004.1 nicotinate (nicotinamide) nucleotide adenylyltransferase [Flavobacteriales bacterium]
MTIACLFGTFDPPHNGHLNIARQVLEQSGVDQVWLVITPMNPFKQDQAISANDHRVAMVRAALENMDGIEVSTEELALPPPNYTADTLAHFRTRWPEHRFRLVMGSDNLAQLDRWKDAEGILEHHGIIVYPRPGYDLHRNRSVFADHVDVSFLEGPVMDLSSTRIRQGVREGKPVDHWVGPQVAAYIAANGLYKD